MAGVVAAGELARLPGVRVDLYEKGLQLGGLQHSVVLHDAAFDIGAFIFTDDHELFEVFPDLRALFLRVRPKHRSLTPAGALDDYPSTVRGFIRDHGLSIFALGLASLLAGKVRYRRRDTLPALVRYYLGDVLYERTGFRGYIERLYGLPDHEIDIEFAVRRLFFLEDVCSLRRRGARAVRRVLRRGAASFDAPDVLVRPEAGFTPVYEAVHAALVQRGVAVHLGSAPLAIQRHGTKEFELILPDSVRVYDRVVSTLPVAVTARLIGEPLGADLAYMRLISLFYRIDGPSAYDAAVVCNLTTSGRWKRLVDFTALYGKGGASHFVTVEVTSRDASAEAASDADRDFRQHARANGLYHGEIEYLGAHVTEHAYPVYRVSDTGRVHEARARLTAWGIDLLGRQGRFEYSTSALVAAQARILASKISEDDRAP